MGICSILDGGKRSHKEGVRKYLVDSGDSIDEGGQLV